MSWQETAINRRHITPAMVKAASDVLARNFDGLKAGKIDIETVVETMLMEVKTMRVKQR